MKFLYYAILMVFTSHAFGAEIAPEVDDRDASKAFRTYWTAFEEYEKRMLSEGRSKYQSSWNELRQKFENTQNTLQSEQQSALNDSIARYREHLQKHANTPNRPYTMTNLAQAMLQLADLKSKSKKGDGQNERAEALSILQEVSKSYPNFENREAALYLAALTQESLGQTDQAQKTWKGLTEIAKKTLYGVHAFIALGDFQFNKENPKAAMELYAAGLNLLERLDIPSRDYEMVRAQYRLAWASYKAAELDMVISVGTALLTPGRDQRSQEQRIKIEKDAVDLVGDALFEQNDIADTTKTLSRKELRPFGGALASRVMQRYENEAQHAPTITIGKVAINEFLSQAQAPEIVNLLASAYKGQGNTRDQAVTLERLAMMLPKQSLWRAKNKNDFEATKRMEELGQAAARFVAAYHYDRGITTGAVPSFVAAGSTYDILIDNDPTGESSSEWRLRRAHCQYFAGEYRDALQAYTELKEKLQVSPAILEVAAYQSVLTQERLWQEELAKAPLQGLDPKTTPAVQTELKQLEKNVQDFANRFPDKQRTVDLLLVMAGSYRDLEMFDQAGLYWQRVLVSRPLPAQRAVAIRGLVMTQMRLGSPGDVVELTQKYLKLEDWSALGLSLANELLGVLSTATIAEGDRLVKAADAQSAGRIMTEVAQSFPKAPQRERIYRDGAYHLAIAGNWSAAEKVAQGYLKENLRQFAGDMQYLLARANEYQLRFATSAAAYYALSEKYPTHPRATSSLERAENLAAAEGEYDLAGKAVKMNADRTKDNDKKMAMYARSVDYFSRANQPKNAAAIATTRLGAAKDIDDRMSSRLLTAKAIMQQGQIEAAVKSLRTLSSELNRQRDQMSELSFSSISGETHAMLGDDDLAEFEDYRLAERSGNLVAKVDAKAAIFDRLSKNYEQAIKSTSPEWSAKGRFQIATAAENFADEINDALVKSDGSVALKQSQRMQETAKRLRELANRYHSNNLAARTKNPAAFRQNSWVRKSSMKLTGTAGGDPQSEFGTPAPTAVQTEIPSQWSL